MQSFKPKNRSKLRMEIGRKYFTNLRYLQWYSDNKKYANHKGSELLPYVSFKHQTPLYRKLKQVDMWMQQNKIINLKLAVNKLNGIMIKPGETFSYWKLIGKPTKRKGYVDGMVLLSGSFHADIGGGLCQLSNLIYWMTLHSPLKVTERYRHNYDVFPDSNRTQPFGSGATCSYNYVDLQIYNDTNHTYQLNIYITDKHLVGEWRTEEPRSFNYAVYEKKHWITHEYWGGYIRHNILHRKVYSILDELIKDEYITENHAIMMYQPFLTNISQD